MNGCDVDDVGCDCDCVTAGGLSRYRCPSARTVRTEGGRAEAPPLTAQPYPGVRLRRLIASHPR
ncbi:hypothetical protein GCM10010341_35260 [Streptomyces noursei]|nr:hypothetical protein GCM10010341_35260 [Streptomyces noursei]